MGVGERAEATGVTAMRGGKAWRGLGEVVVVVVAAGVGG